MGKNGTMNGHEYFSATQALEDDRYFPVFEAQQYLHPNTMPNAPETIGFEGLGRSITKDGILVGAWELIQAAKREQIWHEVHWRLTELSLEFAGRCHTAISINIDNDILKFTEFPERLSACMHKNNVTEGNVTIELTENIPRVRNGRRKTLEKLFGKRKLDNGTMLNVRGSADDHPIGRSGKNLHLIGQINRNTTRQLKVDHTIVRGLLTEMHDRSRENIYESIQLACREGTELVFEGVEPDMQGLLPEETRIRDSLISMVESVLSPVLTLVQIGCPVSAKDAQAILEGKKSLRPHKSQSAPVRSRGSRHVSSSAL